MMVMVMVMTVMTTMTMIVMSIVVVVCVYYYLASGGARGHWPNEWSEGPKNHFRL